MSGQSSAFTYKKNNAYSKKYPPRTDKTAAHPPCRLKNRKRFSVYPPCYTLSNFWACTHASYTLACFFQRVVQRVRFRRVTEGGGAVKKILNFDALKSPRISETHRHFSEIPSPWLKKILNFDALKSSGISVTH